MSKSVKEARPLPDITSIESPHSSTHGKWTAHKPASFPLAYRLIVTTTRGVYAWDMDGVTELFRSGSEGIVAARKLSGTGEMLAVADSQVVVLHDIKKGMQKSYRLKGSEGQVRLLKFAGDSSQNLYFTTSLRNSVQSFSLKYSKILDHFDGHPSPPSVFALSKTAQLLFSASASPPTIYLRNLRANESPILVRPRCSTSAVVAASFHPDTENLFLLAFADGSAAVYDAFLLISKNDAEEPIRLQDDSGAGGEIGSIQRLHAIGSKVKRRTAEDGDWIYDPDGNCITAEATGITAVALVPGQRAMAVTVGADGKCCVIDFTQSLRKKAVVLKSWHLRRPATSLSVVYSKGTPPNFQLDGVVEDEIPANKDYCIAVGRQDGKVLLFDLGGKPLGKQVLDPKGARVVDVEWAKKEIAAAFAEREGLESDSPMRGLPKRSSLGTEVLRKNSKDDELNSQFVYMWQSKDPLFNDESSSSFMVSNRSKMGEGHDLPHPEESPVRSPPKTPQRSVGQALDLLHSEKSVRSPPTTPQQKSNSGQAPDGDGFRINLDTATSGSFNPAELSTSPPPIPLRPAPKPGGKLAMRRAQTAREDEPPPVETHPNLARRYSDQSVSPSKASLSKMSPIRSPLFGPRPSPSTSMQSSIPRLKGPIYSVSPTPIPSNILNPNSFKLTDQKISHEPAAAATEDETAIREDPVRPLLAPFPTRLEGRKSTSSLRSYKTASSRMDLSENSTDTVVDWSASASSRRLDNSIHESSPVHPVAQRSQTSYFPERPKKEFTTEDAKTVKKDEPKTIQIPPFHPSVPSQSSSTHNSGASDSIINWSPLKNITREGEKLNVVEPKPIKTPSFHPSLPSQSSGTQNSGLSDTIIKWPSPQAITREDKKPAKVEPKIVKAPSFHASLPSQSSSTHNSTASDTIIHWPTLRKSPFIADLSTPIESATATVLDTGIYTSPSPSPPKYPQREREREPDDLTTPKQPSSSNPAPSYLPTPSTTTNQKSTRYIPPRLPLRVSPSATATHESYHTCPCEPHLETVIVSEFDSFRVEMAQEFKQQRLWLEELVRGREEGRRELERENGLLREELARLGGGRGRMGGKGGKGGSG